MYIGDAFNHPTPMHENKPPQIQDLGADMESFAGSEVE